MLNFKNRVGYVCTKDNTEIGLLVEGGTVIFDMDSLASSATSNFNFLLNLAYGEQQDVEDGKNVIVTFHLALRPALRLALLVLPQVSALIVRKCHMHTISRKVRSVLDISTDEIELGQETYKHNKQTK